MLSTTATSGNPAAAVATDVTTGTAYVRIKHRKITYFIEYTPKDTVLHLKHRLCKLIPLHQPGTQAPKDIKAIRLLLAKPEMTSTTGAPAGTPLCAGLVALDDAAAVDKTVGDRVILAVYATDDACTKYEDVDVPAPDKLDEESDAPKAAA